MKFTIEGFSQARAVELNLNAEDLVILRWFVDYQATGGMKKFVINGKEYFWVKYNGFIEQMPIISCSKRTIARKFQRLVNADVLTSETIKKDGTYSVYGFGNNYITLVQNNTTVAQESTTVVQKCATPMDKIVQPRCTEMYNQNTNLYNNTNLSNTNLYNYAEKASPSSEKNKSICPYQEILELYHFICKSYPRLRGLTDNRKKHIKARWTENPNIETFRELFENAESSNFLKGNNKRNWKANFDWLMNESNFAKVLEGNYNEAEVKPAKKKDISFDIEDLEALVGF